MHRSKRVPIGVGLGAVAAGLIAAPGSGAQYQYPSPPAAPPSHPQAHSSTSVGVGDFFFRPKTLHVRKGTTVSWHWIGSVAHNVTFSSLHKHSRTQTKGSYSLRFAHAGTFHYLCTIHHFTGTIVVR